MSIPSYVVSAGAHPHMHRCMLVGCSIPVLGAVGYRYVHMHTPVLYILYTLPEMVQCTCTLPLLWCAPQVTSTNHRILAPGMPAGVVCTPVCMYDAHHVVCIYSTVHREQQRTYIVYVYSCALRRSVRMWYLGWRWQDPHHSTHASHGVMVCASLYLCSYVGGVVYTSTLYHSMYTTGCSTGMYLHH